MIGKMFKQFQKDCDIDFSEVDFLDNATNVYRTEEYIVNQHLTYVAEALGITRILSEDTYFLRTKLRDMLYEQLFENDGKRIHASMYVRTYIV